MNDIDIREIAQCSCLRLRRTTRRITQIYDRLLAPSGLTVNQFGLLAHLYGASLRREMLAISTLAERVGMDPTTLTRSLKPLQCHGFIANGTDPADRRARPVLITEAGIAKMRQAVPLWRKAQGHIDAALSTEIGIALNGLLELSYAKLSNSRIGGG